MISRDGNAIEYIPSPDLYTTDICFGGPDLRTAYITLSNSARLVAIDWSRAAESLSRGRPHASVKFRVVD